MGTIADKLTYLNGTKTAIKEAIEAKGVTVADTDTFRSYADKIGEISGGDTLMFAGVPASTMLPSISADGVASTAAPNFPDGVIDLSNVITAETGAFQHCFEHLHSRGAPYVQKIDLSNLQSAGNGAFYYAFYAVNGYGYRILEVDLSSLVEMNVATAFSYAFSTSYVSGINLSALTKITGVNTASYMIAYHYVEDLDLPSLVEINGNYAAQGFATSGYYLRTVNLGALKSVTGNSACQSMFASCSSSTRPDGTKGLESINLDSLEIVNGTSAMNNFLGSTTTADSFEELSFPALHTINGSSAFASFAIGISVKIKRFKFPMLTTISNDAFGNATTSVFSVNTEEIHFREDMEETISAMPGYAKKWGATTATIYFDLPATQPDETEEA